MNNIASIIMNTVPITNFNKGMAGKIFNEVKKTGTKIVMKNNSPECVLVSPDDYIRMVDEVNEAKLLKTALERLQNFDYEGALSGKEFDEKFGITDDMLEGYEGVEFE